MDVPITWIEGLILAILSLLTYIYRQDREENRERMTQIEQATQRNNEAMTVFTANAAAAQQKIAYLEKQLDAIFEMLREIRDELRSKQDKAH